MPIIIGRKGCEDYSFVMDKIRKRLSGWKTTSLSQAGRISLAQSCIMSVPCYVIQIVLLPATICEEVELLCRDFIWGSTPEARKCHLISWDTICAPKEVGGLGFHSLKLVNAAYMLKRGWELISNKDALWVQVLHFKYHCGNLPIPLIKCGTRVSHVWRGICKYWPLV